MQRSIKIILIFFTLITFSIENKNQIFLDLKNKIKNSETISFEFFNNKISGSINISKNNKYKIILNDRIIISNGSTIWNYSISQKQVLVSNFKEINNSSIENIFSSYVINSTVKSLSKSKNSNGEFVKKLKLIDKKNNEEIILFLNQNNLIKQIEINDELWEIENLKFDSPHSTTYEFQPDSSLEIIDFR